MSTRCPDCGKIYQIGDFPFGCRGTGDHRGCTSTLLSSIHPQDRAVIYRNPRTGEVRTPPRNDQPMPAIYARQGYVREELDTHQKCVEYERSTGKIMEALHYDKGSATAERDMESAVSPTIEKDLQLTHRLVEALR